MYEAVIKGRNYLIKLLYKTIAKPIFFRFDPENVHDFIVQVGKLLGSNPLTRLLTSWVLNYSNPVLSQTVAGINFKNPIGLAAGFDKNAGLTQILPAVGFGHMEVGSITGEPCAGNPKPRLWRLKKSQALVVYYGLKNDGCEKIASRLNNKKFKIPVGISVAKTNCAATAAKDAGIADYAKAFSTMKNIGDYITINISCPNAFGGQPFTNADDLEDLLTALEKIPFNKPIFLKLPPDLEKSELDKIVDAAGRHRVSGFICTNLTKDRTNAQIKSLLKDADIQTVGGISGRPIAALSTETIRFLYKKTHKKYIIIGCGGVFSAADAYAKIKAGATLIQLITGMIYEGPQLISEINRGLAELLKKDGYKNIGDAVGADIK